MSTADKVLCVTGGTGYVASWLVKSLLQRGYIVKATVQDPAPTCFGGRHVDMRWLPVVTGRSAVTGCRRLSIAGCRLSLDVSWSIITSHRRLPNGEAPTGGHGHGLCRCVGPDCPGSTGAGRAVLPIRSAGLGWPKDRNRARHWGMLRTFDGVVDFPLGGNSDPSLLSYRIRFSQHAIAFFEISLQNRTSFACPFRNFECSLCFVGR
ncbi:hypothetical protein NL676_003005 [Syzygium grande]|nr:hypothetical protein NL676_003005 [Syzygium grande]